MIIFKLLTATFLILFALVMLSQIIIPAFQGRKLFPFFREQGKLESAKTDAVEEVAIKKFKSEIKSIKKGK